MLPYLPRCEPPSSDKRWEAIAATMRKLGNQRDALIEALHSLQQAFGYLDEPGLRFVAGTLRVPLSQVYGVATFYNVFSLKPQGRHSCVVCTGTACYLNGSQKLLKAVAEEDGIAPGQTTTDESLSLLTARCFGVCGLALVAVIDGETTGFFTPEILKKKLAEVTASESNLQVSYVAR